MLLPAFIIKKHLFSGTLLQYLFPDSYGTVRLYLSVQNRHIKRAQCHSRIPVRKNGNGPEELFFYMDGTVSKSPFIRERIVQKL